jgi:competence protein ComEA
MHMVRTLLTAALVSLLAVAAPLDAQTKSQQPAQGKASAKGDVAGTVNINTASPSELERLPGIGPKTAGRIVEYRQKNGGFKKVEELMNVPGVGEKNFLKLRTHITTGTAAAAAERTAPQQ